jgi:hypothetical protein
MVVRTIYAFSVITRIIMGLQEIVPIFAKPHSDQPAVSTREIFRLAFSNKSFYYMISMAGL